MDAVLDCRTKIYDYFHSNASCQKYFFDPRHEAEYVAYYNSMYLLQDSTEGLWQHRKCGFSRDSLIAYIEFWGVMQAASIQQDSIAEIYEVIVGQQLNPRASNLQSWNKVRDLRNLCAGHPAKRDRPRGMPLTRTFMGRDFGGYNAIRYEQWEDGSGTTYPTISLGDLLDSYVVEATDQLTAVLSAMKIRWP